MNDFDLQLPFEPTGDQPKAIRDLARGIEEGRRWQTLLGVTGSGKTVTMAGLAAETGRPTLVMSHNKTLAAQLYGELKQFFPHNAVEFFISYYDFAPPRRSWSVATSSWSLPYRPSTAWEIPAASDR